MNARIGRFLGVAFGRMAAKRTPLKQGEAFLPIPDDKFLISTLVSCFQYLEQATRDSGEEKVHAASELVNAAWDVMEGTIDPAAVLKWLRAAPFSDGIVTYPRSTDHEFGTMAALAQRYLGGGRALGEDQKTRALIIADFISEALHSRLRVSLRLRQASERMGNLPEFEDKLNDARDAIARILQREDEETWPTLRAKVIRAGLRAFGIPQNLFKNELFELPDE